MSQAANASANPFMEFLPIILFIVHAIGSKFLPQARPQFSKCEDLHSHSETI